MVSIKEETGSPEAPPLPRIGRREHIDFPEWGVRRVRAKVDTGAYTSSLDVAGHELLDTDDGQVVEMRLALNRRRPNIVRVVRAPVVGFATVRSSTGCQ